MISHFIAANINISSDADCAKQNYFLQHFDVKILFEIFQRKNKVAKKPKSLLNIIKTPTLFMVEI